ncbi:MAG TPA: pyrroloquinoline quinone-dependent dehydrogenase, partial [Bryobacteraceae bacterium]
MRKHPFVAACVLAALIVASGCAGPQNKYRNWSSYGGSLADIRYSPLTQVNRSNVKDLQVAWTFDTHDGFPGSELECNPLIVNGVLYASTPKVNVVALNAATGKLLWRFNPDKSRKVFFKMRNRGVSYWSDGKAARIYFAYRQYLYSLD